MRKYYNKLYRLSAIINLINKDIPKLKEVMVEWYNNNKLNHKLQKLPMGRKKKLEG